VKTLDDLLPATTTRRAASAATVAFAWVATFGRRARVRDDAALPNILAEVPRSLVGALEFMSVAAGR
jgi:hypothetical protein